MARTNGKRRGRQAIGGKTWRKKIIMNICKVQREEKGR